MTPKTSGLTAFFDWHSQCVCIVDNVLIVFIYAWSQFINWLVEVLWELRLRKTLRFMPDDSAGNAVYYAFFVMVLFITR
jgi:hypothetical protein